MIPSNITREHCIQAARVVGDESVPEKHRAKKYEVIINGRGYPPKWIIHVANEFANGERHSTSQFSGENEANSFLSERQFAIRRMGPEYIRDFLFRSLPESVDVGKPLGYAASNQLKKVEVGDRVWIVTSRGKQVLLIGVIPVESVGDRAHATKQLGYIPAWGANFYAIGPRARDALAVEIDISGIADQLRFVSDTSDRLDFTRNNIAQQLKAMRLLTPESARLLSELLDYGDAAGTSGGSAGGAGFSDPETNRKVEKAAGDVVRAHFESLGYTVTSKELDRIGYDLLCTNDVGERHVEVKGIQGDSPVFTMTPNERLQAEVAPDWELVLGTTALTAPTMLKVTGSEFLAEYSLKPNQFRAEPKQE
jgi:hypothetical protein